MRATFWPAAFQPGDFLFGLVELSCVSVSWVLSRRIGLRLVQLLEHDGGLRMGDFDSPWC